MRTDALVPTASRPTSPLFSSFLLSVCGLALIQWTLVSIEASAQELPKPTVERTPPEISGIVVYQDKSQEGAPTIFAVVSNSVAGSYYKNFLKHVPPVGKDATFPPRALRTPLKPALEKTASDLEDVGVLNGEVVVLSENSASLISEKGVAIDYSGIESLREVNGRHGLEGLAIRSVNDTDSRIAVLWEGGRSEKPLPPRIFLHQVTRDQLARGTLKVTRDQGQLLTLDQAMLCQLTGEAEPTPFRATAVVWTKLGEGAWGLIVLVGVDERARYDKHWLIRLDEQGRVHGKAHSLVGLGMRPDIAAKNWEGMSWHPEGDALILVDDVDSKTPGLTTLCVLKLPQPW